MRIIDVMTKDPVTVESAIPIHRAEKTMRKHKVRKLPVLNTGKFVGMLTYDMLMEVSPSKATSLSFHEIHYLLAEMKVQDIMDKKPVTLSPDTPLEDALILSQDRGIHGFPVVEDGKLVGIITRGDIIRLMTRALGLREDGIRITVESLGGRLGELTEIIAVFDRHKAPVLSMMTLPRLERKDWLAVMRLRASDATPIVDDLKDAGFQVSHVDHSD